MTDAISRVPPHSEEAEQALIGCVLQSGDIFPKTGIATDDLYILKNRLIWQTFLRLYSRGVLIDPLTVCDDAKVNGTLDDIGGESRINEIVTSVYSHSVYDHYAKIVRENAMARDIIRLGADLMERGYTEAGKNGCIQHASEEIERVKVAYADPLDSGWTDMEAVVDDPDEADIHFWPNVVVDGLVTLFAGSAKVGKSTILAAFIRAFTENEPWLGRPMPHGGGKVLIVSEEPGKLIRRNLKKFGVRRKVSWMERKDSMGKPWPKLVEAAFRIAKKKGCSIIIFDTLSSLAGIENENDAAEVNTAMRPLLEASGKYGMACVAVHHFGKNDDIRGSTAFKANADVLTTFRRASKKPDDMRRELHSEGRIDPSPVEVIRLDTSVLPWTYVSEGPKVNDPQPAFKRNSAMVDLLDRRQKWMTVSQIAKAHGVEVESAGNALRCLFKEGRIQRSGDVQGGAGEFTYAALGVPVVDAFSRATEG